MSSARHDHGHDHGHDHHRLLDADGNVVVLRDVRTRWGRWWSGHERLLRALALLALAWGAAYLVWRIGWSWRDANTTMSLLLLVCEAGGWLSLAGLTWFSWSERPVSRPQRRSVDGAAPDIDVYVCTYDEPVDVVMPTLAGCAALTVPHTTYLLDDGRRTEMRALAERCGAVYMTRPDNRHAKAGNINHALGRTSGDLVFVLDADHVPLPDALEAIVGYFDDPTMAVVQTPHGFYNDDSFQHYDTGRHEQSVFYEVICPGKDRHGGAFWCGSAALLRRRAMLAIGGVATETIAEDFHTTIKLQRAGWTTRYHHEHLVQGVAPHDLGSYLLQRDRWARGNLSVFHTPESPLRARELTARQRLSYATSLFAYLAGPIRALLLAVLALVLWTGALPIQATWFNLAVLWAPATVLMLLAGSALTRGYMRVKEATHFELLTAEIHLRALRCLVRPGRTTFRVTPKEGVDVGGWERVGTLRLLVTLAVGLASGLVWRGLDAIGVVAAPALPAIAVWLIPLLAVVELRRLLRTLRFVGRRRQVRLHARFPLTAPVRVVSSANEHRRGTTTDISTRGLAVVLDAPLTFGMSARATVELPTPDGTTETIEVRVRAMRSRRRADGEWEIGLRVERLDERARLALVRATYVCVLPELVRRVEPAAPLASGSELWQPPVERLAFDASQRHTAPSAPRQHVGDRVEQTRAVEGFGEHSNDAVLTEGVDATIVGDAGHRDDRNAVA